MASVGIKFSEESKAEVTKVAHSYLLTPEKQEVWWPPLKHQEAMHSGKENF